MICCIIFVQVMWDRYGVVDSTLKRIIAKVEKQCTESGFKLTKKRKSVLIGLVQSGKALSAYELADYCRVELDEAMPAMSVYRILGFLEAHLFVHKLKLANKYIACSHIACDHSHGVSQFLICDNCQSVKEINLGEHTMASLREVVQHAGFQLSDPQLEISGVCDKCVAVS